MKNESDILFYGSGFEESALEQLDYLRIHPIVKLPIVVLPDCHCGYGVPIGTVFASETGVMPNAVGVDIGCGMIAIETDIDANTVTQGQLEELLENLSGRIPTGTAINSKECGLFILNYALEANKDSFGEHSFTDILDDDKLKRIRKSIGTLGGGNHFVEIQKSIEAVPRIHVMIHSGSRYLGKLVGDYYHKKAIEIEHDIPHQDLTYLDADTTCGRAYRHAYHLCADYAILNRRKLMERVIYGLTDVFGTFTIKQNIQCMHNSLEEENGLFVHRKGANCAKKGQTVLIPGSAGTPSYWVVGNGHPESYHSCSHGAGRCMGRNDATRSLSVDEVEDAMKAVVHLPPKTISHGKLKGEKDLGEAPQAYKDIHSVIESQLDIITPIKTLIPLMSLKG